MKLFFILLVAFVNIFANEFIELNTQSEKLDDFQVLFHKDKNNNLQYEEVKNITFEEKISNRFSLGYIDHPVWIKISAFNNSSLKSNYILAFEEPFYDRLSLYYEKGGKLHSFYNSIQDDVKNRQLPHPNSHFKISFEPYEKIDFYIKIRSYFPTFSEIFFYSENYYNFEAKSEYFVYLVYLGAIVVIAFYNFILFLQLKERIYLYYFGYTFNFAIWMGAFSGLFFFFIPIKYGYFLQFSAPLAIIFFILFSNKILDIKQNYPRVHKVTKLTLYFCTVLLLWSPLDIFIGFQLVNIVTSYIFIMYLILSFLEAIKGNEIAKYYLIAIGIFLISISFVSLMAIGIVPNTVFTRYFFIAGSFIEIVMFSLLLAFRIDLIQKEYQSKLEKEVVQKTDSINQQNIQLQELLKDKEILIKEIFHRVQNNFQILIAYLSKESFTEKDSSLKRKYTKVISRIKSLSIVSDMLYSRESKKYINIKEYFEIFFNHAIDNEKKVEIDIDDMQLKAELTKKLGLLVNEMITNTLKYNQEQNNLTIEFSIKMLGKNKLKLEYKDSNKHNIKKENQGYGTIFIEDLTSSFKNCNIKKGINDFHYIIEFDFKDNQNS